MKRGRKGRAAGWLLCALLSLCTAGPAFALGSMETEVGSFSRQPVTIELEEAPSAEEISHLSVGVTTPLTGHFFTGMWGRGTSDIDIRLLLHAYDLVRWNGDGGYFEANPAVVRNVTRMENARGDKSFVVTLADDLYYSDGTRITARDYAFSFLLETSPLIGELGGIPEDKSYISGCREYVSGEASALSGIRVLSDDVLMITLDHEALPYFYESGLLSVHPYPIHVIAPGVEVRDEGEGVFLANAQGDEGPARFTAELLRETLLDPASGYMSHPSVVSGPYRIVSWDGETVELVRNPYYKNYQGYILKYPLSPEDREKSGRMEIAYIETLTVRYVPDEQVMEQLSSGDIDLINKVTRAETIRQGMQLIRQSTDQEGYSMLNYPRTGLGYISFACEREELSRKVRQAMAFCMDRDAVTEDITGGFGLRVDGFYGVGQWMYSLARGTLVPVQPPEDEADAEAWAAYEAEVEAWNSLSLDGLDPYGVDVRKAASLLEADGWTKNEETGICEKKVPGEGGSEKNLTLEFTLAYPEENTAIAGSLEKHWLPWLEQAGIRVTLVPMEYRKLIRLYYGWDDREEANVQMFFLASNFDILFDPVQYFRGGEEDTEGMSWAYTRLEDPELYRLAEEMRSTEPSETLQYLRKWIAFQERFNTVLPLIPIYSNTYFDFFTSDLHDYAVTDYVSWSSRIVDAKRWKN